MELREESCAAGRLQGCCEFKMGVPPSLPPAAQNLCSSRRRSGSELAHTGRVLCCVHARTSRVVVACGVAPIEYYTSFNFC